jgi:hypothetical protein
MHNCLEILTVVLSFRIASVIMSQTSMMFTMLDMRRHLTVVLVLFLESTYNQISSTKKMKLLLSAKRLCDLKELLL